MFFDSLGDEVEYYKEEYFGGFHSESHNLIVCIENYDDKPFWYFVFSKISNLKPAFIDLDGKDNLKKFKNYFDKEFIACVDSDYDYILRKPYLENPYIFHTYVYAVENYCLCPKALNSLKSTCNISIGLDFEVLLTQISAIFKEALFYDIYLKETNQDCQRDVFKFKNISIENLNEAYILTQLQTQVSTMLENVNIDLFSPYEEVINSDIYINENLLHLYTEGHIMFESIFNLFKEMQNQNSNKKREEIKEKYQGQQRGDKLRELKNKEFDIDTLLRINYKEAYLVEASSIHQIILDIKNQSLGAV